MTVMLAVPAALSNRWPVKAIFLALAILLMSQLTVSTYGEYGAWAALCLIWLVYANFGSAFFTRGPQDTQTRLAMELVLRWLVYIVTFMTIPAFFDLPTIVDAWAENDGGLWTGFIYFGFVAYLESICFFPKNISRIMYLLNSPGKLKIPRYRIRDLQGKIRGYPVMKHLNHYRYWFFLLGLLIAALVTVFFLASLGFESWLGRVLLWLFLLPFAMIGCMFLLAAPVMGFKTLSMPRSLLRIDRSALQEGHLLATASYPNFFNAHKDARAKVVCYRILKPADDSDVQTAEQCLEASIDQVQFSCNSEKEHQVAVDKVIPDLNIGGSSMQVERLVWQLQVTLTGEYARSDTDHQWVVGYPLPFNRQGM